MCPSAAATCWCGQVAVPREVEDDALRLAEAKLSKEDLTRQGLIEGKTLRQVFDQYGVL